jgi:hypothetical protein
LTSVGLSIFNHLRLRNKYKSSSLKLSDYFSEITSDEIFALELLFNNSLDDLSQINLQENTNMDNPLIEKITVSRTKSNKLELLLDSLSDEEKEYLVKELNERYRGLIILADGIIYNWCTKDQVFEPITSSAKGCTNCRINSNYKRIFAIVNEYRHSN